MAYTPKKNWQKGEVLEAADMNRVESGISDLYTRLNVASSTDTALQPGIQTITADRDKPFNLKNIIGRMLLNLLGRFGTFDSVTGWSFTGASGAVTTANSLYGVYALLMTLSATSSRVSRSVNTVVGKTYVVAVSVRLGTAASATVDVTGLGSGNTINSSNGYQTTYMRFTATAATHMIGLTVTGSNGQTVYVDGFRVYEVSAGEYGAVPSLNAAGFAALYPYTEGLAGVKNPYAICWTDDTRSEIAALIAFDTELLAPPVLSADAERDTLQVRADGSYYKTTIWRKLTLGGDLPWTFKSSSTGIKRVQITGLGTSVATTPQGYLTKYDGQIGRSDLGAIANWTVGDIWQLGDASYNNFYLSVSVIDSGWGDSYTPSDSEIKAYFYGWVMYDGSQPTNNPNNSIYNGSGTKAWARRADGMSRTFADPTATLPTTLAPNFTPYELMYKRAIAITEPVSSEGAMSFVQGNNTIEVGSGLVIRESVRPQTSAGYYWINGNTPVSSALKDKTMKFISVYRNGRPESWNFLGFTDDANKLTLGYQQARILADQFSNDDTYSVSYLPLRYYPVGDFIGSTPNNEKAILDDLTKDVQQLTGRVSVAELKKVDKGSLSWITPTVVGGWNPLLDFAYRIEGSRIYFRGILSNGATASGTLIFTLPDRVRTQRSFTATLGTYGGSSGQTVAIDFLNNGQVKIVVASALAQISFEGFSYSLD